MWNAAAQGRQCAASPLSLPVATPHHAHGHSTDSTMQSEQELTGRVALGTGAARNIGRSIALELAAAGAAVAINTRASRTEAEALAAEIRAGGGRAAAFLADIADGAAVARMHAAVAAELGTVDLLVLNASVRREVAFETMSFDEWRQVMSISLDGSFHCIQAVLPGMLKAGRGDIVTLAGDTALTGAVGKVHSSVAKNGLTGMTRALAREFGARGVNCIAPGFIASPMTDVLNEQQRDAILGRIPLGRLGTGDEIAAAAVYLASEEAAYVTGQTLHVNGGMYMS